MRDHTKEPAENDVENAEGRVAEDRLREPGAAAAVLGKLLAVRVDEDIDVRDEHGTRRADPAATQNRRGPHPAEGRRRGTSEARGGQPTETARAQALAAARPLSPP